MRFPTSKRGEGRRAHSRRKFALGAAVCLLALAACLAACAPSTAPQPTDTNAAMAETGESDGGDADASTTGSFSTAADFTDVSTGMFPDIQRNAEFQNAGNRGCAACHDDLFTLDKNNGSFVHITNQVGMKKGSYNGDCVVCHYQKMGTAGNIMSENLHVRHYSSPEFVNANGNCWSCHVTDTDEGGNIIMKLFEDVKYDMRFGGYPNEDETDIHWLERHGWDEGTFSGVVREADPKLDVQVDQATSAEEDEFNILNFERIEGEDAYDQIEKSVNDDSYRFTVEGVGKPGEYTLDDPKAMPQTAIYPDGATDLQSYIDNDAVIVLERYGHDLNIAQGGPVEIFVPGTGGTATVKNLVGIKFSKTDNPPVYSDIAVPSIEAGALINMNTSWFDNDGVQAKVGEPVTLEGASWGWTFGDACNYEVDKILFSLDYGQNWTEVDSPDSFDPYQWTHFTMTWTPEKAGTYIAKAKAVSKNGVERGKDASIIIQVSE